MINLKKQLSRFLLKTEQLISSNDFLERHRLNDKAFTRNRKLPFSLILKYILSLPQKSLANGLDNFLWTAQSSNDFLITKQAFSKQRQLISPSAFHELFNESALFAASLPEQLWNGHTLYAIDGTYLQLPNTIENRLHFGCATNDSEEPLPMAMVSALYNVSNDHISDVIISPYTDAERDHATRLIDSFKPSHNKRQPVLLCDRGYPSRDVFYSLIEHNWFFVIRCSSNASMPINKAPLGDSIIYDDITPNQFKLQLRVIKTPLPNGTIEVLVTNLMDKHYTPDMFLALYNKRWTIETKYDEFKNRLFMENFTGRTVTSIYQDFFAALFISNIVSIFKSIADNRISEKLANKNLKNTYHANRSFIIGCVTRYLTSLIQLSRKRGPTIDSIIHKSLFNRSEKRPDRPSITERRTRHPKVKFHPNHKNNI